MATETTQIPEEQQTLEHKIADLHIDLPEKVAVGDTDGRNESVADSASEKHTGLGESDVGIEKPTHEAREHDKVEKSIGDAKEDASCRQEEASREMEIAKGEVAKNSDGAYIVPTTDHQSRVQGDHEKKENVPTGIVHENAQPKDEQPQSKGILQSMTGRLSQTVKSVFGGRSGSKSFKDLDAKKTVCDN